MEFLTLPEGDGGGESGTRFSASPQRPLPPSVSPSRTAITFGPGRLTICQTAGLPCNVTDVAGRRKWVVRLTADPAAPEGRAVGSPVPVGSPIFLHPLD